MIRHVTQLTAAEVNLGEGEDFDTLAIQIISTLTKNAQCFERSSNLYNSDFFKDEDGEFKLTLCTALSDFFYPFQNSFWNSNRRPEV